MVELSKNYFYDERELLIYGERVECISSWSYGLRWEQKGNLLTRAFPKKKYFIFNFFFLIKVKLNQNQQVCGNWGKHLARNKSFERFIWRKTYFAYGNDIWQSYNKKTSWWKFHLLMNQLQTEIFDEISQQNRWMSTVEFMNSGSYSHRLKRHGESSGMLFNLSHYYACRALLAVVMNNEDGK